MKKHSANLLHVCVGDTVEVCFTHETPPRTFNLKVEVVEIRYGHNRDGSKMNPLVAGVNMMTMKNEICDLSYVRRVISRAEVEAPKRNVFREFIESEGSLRAMKYGPYWIGTLTKLTYEAMSLLPFELNRPLHEKRLYSLYKKSFFVGCALGEQEFHKVVNKRRFCKWVAKNWHRILMTSKELHALANQELEQQRRDLEDDADIETESVIDSRS